MNIDDLDISQELYERLSTDKYGGWVEVFGRDALRQLCDRVRAEIEPSIFEWTAQYEEDYDQLERDFDNLCAQMDKIGLEWDSTNKKLIITEDSPIRKLKF